MFAAGGAGILRMGLPFKATARCFPGISAGASLEKLLRVHFSLASTKAVACPRCGRAGKLNPAFPSDFEVPKV